LALSIRSRAYLSHGTAVNLHGLAKLDKKTIYLNSEQSPKPPSEGGLTQEGIDRAFSGRQRASNLIYTSGGVSIVMINGKNTDRLGVEEFDDPASGIVPVTNLERTLIDIVVRPAYAGGESQLLKAYRAAKDRVSVDRLLATLKQLGYLYPYHQPIGFLMERAGYDERSLAKLRALGLHYNFYLAHDMEQSAHSKEWRLYYPKGLKADLASS